jgi:hypothetical protein
MARPHPLKSTYFFMRVCIHSFTKARNAQIASMIAAIAALFLLSLVVRGMIA